MIVRNETLDPVDAERKRNRCPDFIAVCGAQRNFAMV